MAHSTESLARIPLLRSLTAEQIRRLEQACTRSLVAAGEWAIDGEAEGTDVFFMLGGAARVVVLMGNRETILRDLRPGDCFGELAAIDGLPRSAGIVAVTDTVLARMPAAIFRSTVHQHPDVCDQLLALLAGRIRALANRANEISGLDVRERLWAELLRLGRAAANAPGQMVISPPPTHAELAARIGTHREAVTRELGAMERTALIARRRGAIALTQPARLREMLQRASME